MLLDGFSIGRYAKKRESFGLPSASFESEHCNFLGKITPALEPFKKIDSTLVLLLRGQRTQNPSKWLKIPLLGQKDDNLDNLR